MENLNIPIAKIGRDVPVQWEKLPAETQEFVAQYGLKQILNDCHSSYRMVDEEKGEEPDGKKLFDDPDELAEVVWNQVSEKLEALKAGILPSRGGGGQPADPIVKEAIGIAKLEVKFAAAKAKRKLAKGELEELAKALFARDEARLRNEAKENLAKAKAVEVDLDALMSA